MVPIKPSILLMILPLFTLAFQIIIVGLSRGQKSKRSRTHAYFTSSLMLATILYWLSFSFDDIEMFLRDELGAVGGILYAANGYLSVLFALYVGFSLQAATKGVDGVPLLRSMATLQYGNALVLAMMVTYWLEVLTLSLAVGLLVVVAGMAGIVLYIVGTHMAYHAIREQ